MGGKIDGISDSGVCYFFKRVPDYRGVFMRTLFSIVTLVLLIGSSTFAGSESHPDSSDQSVCSVPSNLEPIEIPECWDDVQSGKLKDGVYKVAIDLSQVDGKESLLAVLDLTSGKYWKRKQNVDYFVLSSCDGKHRVLLFEIAAFNPVERSVSRDELKLHLRNAMVAISKFAGVRAISCVQK